MTVKADTSVKWFHSAMADAPVLRGEAGALIELLDACLISGFSTRSPDSVVVAGGVATVSISAGNPYDKHAVIAISGASEPALNAEWRIDTSAASSFTFLCPGVADGTVTGAALKRAGAGWGKPFADTNVAVYQSLDPASTQLYLRVNDADARYTRVRGYEQMTDANTGTGLFPTLAQLGETLWTWAKSSLADTTPRLWALIGDGRFFYFLPLYRTDATNTGAVPHYFGDIVSLVPNDVYGCVIVAHLKAAPSSTGVTDGHPGGNFGDGGSSYSRYAARSSAQTGAAVTFVLAGGFSTGGYLGSYNTPEQPYPDGNLRFGGPPAALDGPQLTSPFRGYLPGIVLPLGRIVSTSFTALFETDTTAFFGVKAVQVSSSSSTSDTYVSYIPFDIRGPWR